MELIGLTSKDDASHFHTHLVTLDIRRHLPGLYALAERNPKTRGENALLAFSMDYTFAPPQFTVFPAEDVVNDKNYARILRNGSGVLEKARKGKGSRQVHLRYLQPRTGLPQAGAGSAMDRCIQPDIGGWAGNVGAFG